MIKGIGIDIIEIERVQEKIGRDNGFKQKVFSDAEISFCESKANRGQHYAARFAAKEAFLKATGFGLTAGFSLHQIEVCSDETGRPYIALHGTFREQAAKYGWNKIHVSLSHVHAAACAVVIIES
jgi:holo-[acyl-carrier protein] synthase